MSDTQERPIITCPRDRAGLFIQIRDDSDERERIEGRNRNAFVERFNYADPYVGIPSAFQEKGDYACKDCNISEGTTCLILERAIDPQAGSCRHWEDRFSEDAELDMRGVVSAELAAYGVAANGVGFGCQRCPYAEKALEPDSLGRPSYCRKGDFRVFANACCALNGAPTTHLRR